jgi:hypothetical protein
VPDPSPPTIARGAVAAVVAGAALLAVLVVGAVLLTVGVVRSSPEVASPPTAGDAAGEAAGEAVAVGASSDGYAVWARNDDGFPVRWDPCSPIDLLVAPDGAPAGALSDLRLAIEQLREVTGLPLRVAGTTDERPRADRPPFQPDRYGERWAPVLVAWSPPHEGGMRLRTTDRGVAMPIAVGPPGDRTYVTGQVVLNAERTDLRPGFADRAHSWGATILHELGHLLGLDHVDDPDQLMAVHPGAGPVTFGTGDLAGLEAVGAAQGCRPVPTPQHVEVADPPE